MNSPFSGLIHIPTTGGATGMGVTVGFVGGTLVGGTGPDLGSGGSSSYPNSLLGHPYSPPASVSEASC